MLLFLLWTFCFFKEIKIIRKIFYNYPCSKHFWCYLFLCVDSFFIWYCFEGLLYIFLVVQVYQWWIFTAFINMKNLFILLLFLKDTFTEYRILGLYFFFQYLSVFHSLLVYIVSVKNATSFSSFFGVVFFMLLLLGVHCDLGVCEFIIFRKSWKISNTFLFYPSLLFFRDSHYICWSCPSAN